MSSCNLEHLASLCKLHSTPGDEGRVVGYLRNVFSANGWRIKEHGRYALTALSPDWREGLPVFMICAHADAPGFIIQSLETPHRGVAIALGGPDCSKMPQRVQIARYPKVACTGTLTECLAGRRDCIIESRAVLHRGERVCYAPSYSAPDAEGVVHGTFLDNRIGCWALCRLAECVSELKVNVILAVTGGEEMTGFGADILAHEYSPDVVLCLDATYSDEAQGIALGAGPVLTVSDKSTLLSPAVCSRLAEVLERRGIPLQQEIYNYSGTDARAFPVAGFSGPVFAILVATTGNHSPMETADVRDLAWLELMLRRMAASPDDICELKASWHF